MRGLAVLAVSLVACGSDAPTGLELQINGLPGLETADRLRVWVGVPDDIAHPDAIPYFIEANPQQTIVLDTHGPIVDNPYTYLIPRATVAADRAVIAVQAFSSVDDFEAVQVIYPPIPIPDGSLEQLEIVVDPFNPNTFEHNECIAFNVDFGLPDIAPEAWLSVPSNQDCDPAPAFDDCEDRDPRIYPGAPECRGEDLNCDGQPAEDEDCDGIPTGRDCDDNDENAQFPLAPELCSFASESCGCANPRPQGPCYDYNGNGTCIAGTSDCNGGPEGACDVSSGLTVPSELCDAAKSPQCSGAEDVTACTHDLVSTRTLYCYPLVLGNDVCQTGRHRLTLPNQGGGCTWGILDGGALQSMVGFGDGLSPTSTSCSPELRIDRLFEPALDHTSFEALILGAGQNDGEVIRLVVTPLDQHPCDGQTLPLCIDPAVDDPTDFFGHFSAVECPMSMP